VAAAFSSKGKSTSEEENPVDFKGDFIYNYNVIFDYIKSPEEIWFVNLLVLSP
jgi:hypothetical protein